MPVLISYDIIILGKSEPYPELQAVVATLSTGPVGPSDKIGCSDAKLIMKSVNKDGLILKPDRPARAIDDQIVMVRLLSLIFADDDINFENIVFHILVCVCN